VTNIALGPERDCHQPSAILFYFFLALAFVVLAFVLGFAFDVLAADFAIRSPPFHTWHDHCRMPVQSITSLPPERSLSIGLRLDPTIQVKDNSSLQNEL
jgi:hypothetical protein